MHTKNMISCVVLNYNDGNQVLKFISQIKNISLIDNIIIVDNCSTDDSISKFETINNPKVSFWKTEKNGGYGYGNNYGVRIAKTVFNSKLALICNPDIEFDEELIQKISNVFDADPDVAVCSAIQINGFTNKKIETLAWHVPTYFGYTLSSLVIVHKLIPRKKYDFSQNEVLVDCVPGAFLAVDVVKFFGCGGYDERVFLYCEESILGFRLKRCGYKTILLTKYNYYHFHSTSIKKSIPKALQRRGLLLNSRLFYIDHYLKVGIFKHYFAKFIFFISKVEYWLVFKLRE